MLVECARRVEPVRGFVSAESQLFASLWTHSAARGRRARIRLETGATRAENPTNGNQGIQSAAGVIGQSQTSLRTTQRTKGLGSTFLQLQGNSLLKAYTYELKIRFSSGFKHRFQLFVVLYQSGWDGLTKSP